MYNCPVCDQVAGNNTIVCEECSKWFHFDCVGVDKSKIVNIAYEFPFVCIFFNDRTINPDNDMRVDITQPAGGQQDPITINSTFFDESEQHVSGDRSTVIITQSHSDIDVNSNSTEEKIVISKTENDNRDNRKNNKPKKQSAFNKKFNNDGSDTLLA